MLPRLLLERLTSLLLQEPQRREVPLSMTVGHDLSLAKIPAAGPRDRCAIQLTARAARAPVPFGPELHPNGLGGRTGEVRRQPRRCDSGVGRTAPESYRRESGSVDS